MTLFNQTAENPMFYAIRMAELEIERFNETAIKQDLQNKQSTMTKEPKVSAETQAMLEHNGAVTNTFPASKFMPIALRRKGNTDWKQIAGKQDYEVYYVSYSYGIPMDVIRQVIEQYRTSRKRVYAILREMGYVIEYKNRRK